MGGASVIVRFDGMDDISIAEVHGVLYHACVLPNATYANCRFELGAV